MSRLFCMWMENANKSTHRSKKNPAWLLKWTYLYPSQVSGALSPSLFAASSTCRAVSHLEGATTSEPVRKSIRHLPKASAVTHIGFVTNSVQGPSLEIVYHMKYLRASGVWEKSRIGSVHITQRIVLPQYKSRTAVACSLCSTLPLFLPHTPVLTAPADCWSVF